MRTGSFMVRRSLNRCKLLSCAFGLALSMVMITAEPVYADVSNAQVIRHNLNFGVDPGNDDPATWPTTVQWIRLWDSGVTWGDIEKTPHVFDFSRLGMLVAAAHNHHARVLLTLGEAPVWAAKGTPHVTFWGNSVTNAPASAALWTEYVNAITRHFGNHIDAYEVWNEPDLPQFYSGTVHDMVTMTRIAHDSVRTYAPRSILISPAISRYGYTWLNSWITFGGARYVDRIGYHPYPRTANPDEAYTNTKRALAVVASRHVVQPLFIDEVGFRNGIFADSQQAYAHADYVRISQRLINDLHALGMHDVIWYGWAPGEWGLPLAPMLSDLHW